MKCFSLQNCPIPPQSINTKLCVEYSNIHVANYLRTNIHKRNDNKKKTLLPEVQVLKCY